MIHLTGGHSCGQVTITRDQHAKLSKLYGFDTRNLAPLDAAGVTRNLFRYAQADGLRVMAFLSKYLEQGQDPVRLQQELMVEAGFDVQLEEESDGA